MPQNTSAPTISGVAERTGTLIASPGTWTNSPSLAYQWQRCDSSGANCQNIAGATGTTLSARHGRRGLHDDRRVTATNGNGSSAASAAAHRGRGRHPAGQHPPAGRPGPGIDRPAGHQGLDRRHHLERATPRRPTLDLERCDASRAPTARCCRAPRAAPTCRAAADVGDTLRGGRHRHQPRRLGAGDVAPPPVVLPAAPRWDTPPAMSADPGIVGDTITITPARGAARR